MLVATDLGVSDEDLARRVLVRARNIAPCLDSLDGEAKLNAIAILKGVIAEIPAAGTRRVRSKARNGTSITYESFGGAFGVEEISDLRSLCGAASVPGLPIGSFPAAGVFAGVWPEETYL